MVMGRFKVKFANAAISNDPDVLAQIATPQFNLAVWKRAAEPLRQSSYIRNLDLDALTGDEPWRDNYFKSLLSHGVGPAMSTKRRRSGLAHLDEQLAQAGFPEAKLERSVNRKVLGEKLYDFAGHFAAAMGQRVGFTLLKFRPDPGMFWHTDDGPARAIVTLRGDEGTLWRPDQSLPAGKPRNLTYWGPVKLAHQPYAQTLAPGDMAIFKCRGNENPLVHASPLCTKTRLVMIMGMG